jgi:peptidyl-prolyl cis-trans isomerase C
MKLSSFIISFLLLFMAIFFNQLALAIKATASHILVKTKEEADNLLNKIRNENADFAELARKHSTCPSKAKGGSLGTFSPGQMVKEFDDATFNKATVGEPYGPVKTQFGYHLILVTAKN